MVKEALTVSGQNTEVYKMSRSITISNNCSYIISGNNNINVSKDVNKTFNKNLTTIVSGNLLETVTGKKHLTIYDDVYL